MPPACLILDITVASSVGTKSWYTLDPLVVKMPAVWYWSFTATGTPANGPAVPPLAKSLSKRPAASRASSRHTVMYAFKVGSSLSIRSRYA